MSNQEQQALQRLIDARFASRLFANDVSLWGEDAQAEAAHRLHWVDAPLEAQPIIAAAEQYRRDLVGRGVNRFVLAGMGGSSLGPSLLARNAGVRLEILDSTHPDALFSALTDLDSTALIVSSKSGNTVETRSHLALFEAEFRAQDIDPRNRLFIITDPGSELEKLGRDAGYTVILANPNVGGRFSVFTAFGLVPPILAGAELKHVVKSATDALTLLAQDTPSNPALTLAAAASTGTKTLWLAKDKPFVGLSDWVEQLVAESTGKAGDGVLPVVSARAPREAVDVHEVLPGHELGATLVTWMVATAAMGFLLGVNPFDQPDVERAKAAARTILSAAASGDEHASLAPSYVLLPYATLTLASLVAAIKADLTREGYVSVELFAPQEVADNESVVQEALQADISQPVTVGWGPRFLHSTGQLHKGGAPNGVHVQVVAPWQQDITVPEQSFTFGELLRAQADGDARVLTETGQAVFRIEATVEAVVDALRG